MEEFEKNDLSPVTENKTNDTQQTQSVNTEGSAVSFNPVPPNNASTYHYSYTNHNNVNVPPPVQSYGQPTYYNPVNQTSGSTNAYAPVTAAPKKKSKRTVKILIVAIVLCVIVAGACSALAITGNKGSVDKGSGKDDKPSSSQQGNTAEDGGASVIESEEVPVVSEDGSYTVAGVAKECMDSCVGITVYSQQYSAYEYFYGYGSSDSGEPTKAGEGSGVLMSEANGKTYIMTCAHVITNADSFTVTLNNGEEYDAKLVGADAQTDIGVLSIEKTGLKIAKFADSEQFVVGEQVVAIGCPGGLEFINSLTSGYISALARPIASTIGYDTECIQIDAPINPGNSGGALLNMQGQVIGINSSKIAATEYEGIGFAVPSNTAVETANSLIKVGYVEGRAKIGLTYSPITSFDNGSAVVAALEDKGFKDCQGAMVIDEVAPESDLSGKDIKKYDMIVAANGKTMTSQDVLTSILADSKPGDTIKLTIARINGRNIETFEVDCKLIESKD